VNIILFGYPKTGKTTLFNILTGANVPVSTYGDGKREPNLRTCPIPDSRLDRLGLLHPDKKKVPLHVDFTDLVGISFGEVQSGLLLAHLHAADGLIHVVRGFADPGIPHPRGRISPSEDMRFMEEELVLSDLAMVQARLEKLDRDLKKMKDPEGEKERDILLKLRPVLEEGKSARELLLSPAEEKLLRGFAFLSRKPLCHMINLDERDLAWIEKPGERFGTGSGQAGVWAFCGRIEAEIQELADEEKDVFMSGYGLREPSAGRFFRNISGLLDIVTFYTIGKDEVRAWSVPRNSPAQKAAGVIHSDIEKGFIRAEVIAWEDLVRQGTLPKARDAGAVRLEGKDYPVRDGDVIHFRFAQ